MLFDLFLVIKIISYVNNHAKGYKKFHRFYSCYKALNHLLNKLQANLSPCVRSCGKMLCRTRMRQHWSCSPAPCPHRPDMSCPSSGRSWMPPLRNQDSSGHIPAIGEKNTWLSTMASLSNICADLSNHFHSISYFQGVYVN